MQSISTITQKGQVTIPISIRSKLQMKPYGRVRLVVHKDHVKVYPTQDILAIAGSFVPKGKKSVLHARDAMEKTYTRF